MLSEVEVGREKAGCCQRASTGREVVKVEEKDSGSLEEWLKDTSTHVVPQTTEDGTRKPGSKHPSSKQSHSNHQYHGSRGRPRHSPRREGRWLRERTNVNRMQSENRTGNIDQSGYGKTDIRSQQNSSPAWSVRGKQHCSEGGGSERLQCTAEDKVRCDRVEDCRYWTQDRCWYGRSEQRPRSGARGYRGEGRGGSGRGRGRGGRGGGWSHQDDVDYSLKDGSKCGGRGSVGGGGDWRGRRGQRRGTGRGQHEQVRTRGRDNVETEPN